VAAKLKITKISELRQHPELRLAFSTEFLQRSDGWPGLKEAYDLPHKDIKLMEHGLALESVRLGEVDATDVYATDAAIQQYNLRVLEDDLHYFPAYECVLLYRADLSERAPSFDGILKQLEGAISTEEIQRLNAQVKVDRVTERRAAAGFLSEEFNIESDIGSEDRLASRILRYTLEHLLLVSISLVAGIAVAIPLGVIAAKRRRWEHLILSTAEVIQTIPGLALLVMLMPAVNLVGLKGAGPAPVIVALFLYSLLPIIRNTFTGMRDIPHSLRESAQVLGLTPWATLWQIELPLASRTILAGIKTTAVMTVGYATLGGLIGAGGFGTPIQSGLSKGDNFLTMEGAIPAAVLALLVKSIFEIAERFVVPKGLRVQSQG
jgi:osmoprotectant transport system permease protein